MRANDFEFLNHHFRYCSETGAFYWKNTPPKAPVKVDGVAGTKHSTGYIVLKLMKRTFRAHRVAWLLIHGHWPTLQIDHINGVRHDNRLVNLRDVAPRANSQNRCKPNANNSSGLIGASKHKGRFSASIRIDGKQTFLGVFDTPEEANRKYLQTKQMVHPAFVSRSGRATNT